MPTYMPTYAYLCVLMRTYAYLCVLMRTEPFMHTQFNTAIICIEAVFTFAHKPYLVIKSSQLNAN